MNDLSKGGLNIDVNLQFNSFKLKWVLRCFDHVDDTQSKWKLMFDYWCDKLGGSFILRNCKYDPKYIQSLKAIPKFYREILYVYFTFKKRKKG